MAVFVGTGGVLQYTGARSHAFSKYPPHMHLSLSLLTRTPIDRWTRACLYMEHKNAPQAAFSPCKFLCKKKKHLHAKIQGEMMPLMITIFGEEISRLYFCNLSNVAVCLPDIYHPAQALFVLLEERKP